VRDLTSIWIFFYSFISWSPVANDLHLLKIFTSYLLVFPRQVHHESEEVESMREWWVSQHLLPFQRDVLVLNRTYLIQLHFRWLDYCTISVATAYVASCFVIIWVYSMYPIVYQSNPPHAILSDKRMQDALEISAVTRCPRKAKESTSARTKLPICMGIRAGGRLQGCRHRRWWHAATQACWHPPSGRARSANGDGRQATCRRCRWRQVIRPKRIYFPEHFCCCSSSNLCVLNTTNMD
jgi:hypothetical protein